MLEITKMLSLSTAHISKATSEKLKTEQDTNAMGLTLYEKTGSGESYGWFLYLDATQPCGYSKEAVENGLIPKDLAACMALTNDTGCTILCLDCDAPIVPYLKQFDWD